ncbi:hypothetical protein ACLMJK_000562 [Lecanora helva]
MSGQLEYMVTKNRFLALFFVNRQISAEARLIFYAKTAFCGDWDNLDQFFGSIPPFYKDHIRTVEFWCLDSSESPHCHALLLKMQRLQTAYISYTCPQNAAGTNKDYFLHNKINFTVHIYHIFYPKFSSEENLLCIEGWTLAKGTREWKRLTRQDVSTIPSLAEDKDSMAPTLIEGSTPDCFECEEHE